MTPNERFDDLLRRKFGERPDAFHEGDWEQMRHVIASARARKRRGWLFIMVALLVVTTVAGWLLVAGHGEGLKHGLVDAEPPATPVDAGSASTEGPVFKPQQVIERAAEQQQDAEASAMRDQTNAVDAPDAIDHIGKQRMVPGTHTTTRSGSAAITGSPTQAAAQHGPDKDERIVRSGTQEGSAQGEGPRVMVAPWHAAPVAVGASEQGYIASTAGSTTNDVHPDDPTVKQEQGHDPRSAANAPMSVDPAMEVAGDQPASEQAVEAVKEVANASVPRMVQDTLTATAASLDPPPPAVNPMRPWELALTGGALLANHRYTGPATDWTSGSTGRWSGTYGVEAMRMGRHFGVGLGVHATSYHERLAVDARDREGTQLITTYSLGSADTTVLVITDSIAQGGQTFYVAQPQTTTIFFLQSNTDTLSLTERIRQARVLDQRLSYVEIPLLLDAHVERGRWLIGLRGGPTVGVLIGRRLELPVGPEGAFVQPSSEAYTRLVPGYLLRAYVRYRWQDAWSVGVDPMLRGQFADGLFVNGTGRRVSGMGAVLSMAYHLR